MLKTKAMATIIIPLLIAMQPCWSANLNTPVPNLTSKDPHKDKLGFFDIHYCNWPDREPFLMLLYATHHYQEIEDLTIFKPNGEVLTHIDKSKYRYLPTAIVDGKTIPDKKVFINQIPVTNQDEDGVYSVVIATTNGLKHHYHDLVETEQLIALPTLNSPNHQSSDISLTPTLKWGQVKGAKLYQVFIKDNWTGKTVLTSKMLSETKFTVPNDLLKSGGWYAWKVHARDMDETKIYGDFNAGSISRTALFSTIE